MEAGIQTDTRAAIMSVEEMDVLKINDDDDEMVI